MLIRIRVAPPNAVWGWKFVGLKPMKYGEVYKKKRVSRNIKGVSHELTFSTYKGQPFFLYKPFCDYFVDAVTKAKDLHNFDVRAFVIMPEHIHILITPRNKSYSISKILLSIKQSVSRRAINHLTMHAPEKLKSLETSQKHSKRRFWQDGGGYDRDIFTQEAFNNSIQYIHHNPVKRKLVPRKELWHYSSYRFWKGKGDSPIECVRGGL